MVEVTGGAPELVRFSTGVATLDGLLGGGLPAQSLTVLSGAPGSGKTILAMHMIFNQARAGKRCLYFTTLSEPPSKLLRYMQQFAFFDTSLVDDRVSFIDLGSALIAGGPKQALQLLRERLEQEEPDFVIVDSFRAFHDLGGTDQFATRALVYELAVSLAAWGSTTVLLGEYTADESSALPEFAVADGIIRLSNERYGLTRFRELEIQKMRGADYTSGVHFFAIDRDGLQVYPRISAVEERLGNAWSPERVITGFAGLDEMLGGGLPANSTTMIKGGSGTGKTLLSLGFLMEGARRSEPGVHFGLEEHPAQLRRTAATLGWDLPALEQQGLISLHHAAPVEMNADRYMREVLGIIDATGAKRVVFDSLSALRAGIESSDRYRQLLYALIAYLRDAGVTCVLTMEVSELLGTSQLTGGAVSSVADNVVLLRYVELEGKLGRAISVLKARGIAHGTDIRRFSVGETGPVVGEGFPDLRGVLTGVPQPRTN